MRNRVITVPKDKISEKLLDYAEANPEQLIEFEITEEDFCFLYRKNIINLINKHGAVNIDDYEDEHIIDKALLQKVIIELERIKVRLEMSEILILEQVIKLFKEAVYRNTGVYFFF